MDYYIKLKEDDKEGAKDSSTNIVSQTNQIFIKNIQKLISILQKNTGFYNEELIDSYDAAKKRILFLKHVIEDCDGYKLFYNNGMPIKKEKDLQLLFKFTWFATKFDVNAEVNNGRGPVDYKISLGAFDQTLVEFKLAKNSKLKQNLKKQVDIYERANGTNQSLKVIMYFTGSEYKTVLRALEELKLDNNENIILIDACDNKASASNMR